MKLISFIVQSSLIRNKNGLADKRNPTQRKNQKQDKYFLHTDIIFQISLLAGIIPK
jgi:hypothetical protein